MEFVQDEDYFDETEEVSIPEEYVKWNTSHNFAEHRRRIASGGNFCVDIDKVISALEEMIERNSRD